VANEASAHSGGRPSAVAVGEHGGGGRRAVETTGFFPTVKSPFLRASVQDRRRFLETVSSVFRLFFLIN